MDSSFESYLKNMSNRHDCHITEQVAYTNNTRRSICWKMTHGNAFYRKFLPEKHLKSTMAVKENVGPRFNGNNNLENRVKETKSNGNASKYTQKYSSSHPHQMT